MLCLLGLNLGLNLLLLGEGGAVPLELLLLAGEVGQALPEVRGRRCILILGMQLRNRLVHKVLGEYLLLQAPGMQRGEEAQIELLVGLILPQVLLEPDDLLSDLRSIGEHVEVLGAEHLDERQVERAVEVKEAGDGGAV